MSLRCRSAKKDTFLRCDSASPGISKMKVGLIFLLFLTSTNQQKMVRYSSSRIFIPNAYYQHRAPYNFSSLYTYLQNGVKFGYSFTFLKIDHQCLVSW